MERGGRNQEGWREVVGFRKDGERWLDSGRMERGGRNREGWREVVGIGKDGEVVRFRKDEERW